MKCAEYQVSRQRSLNCHFSGLCIADFTDKDHVGCLTKHRTNDSREVETNVVLDLNLVNAGQVILDRVFGGDDLPIGAVQFAESTIQSRCLAASGGAGHKEDAVWATNDRLEAAIVFLTESKIADTHLDVFSVENSQHDGLSMARGEDADSKVEVFSTRSRLDAAVLRTPFFRNVHPCHDFDA